MSFYYFDTNALVKLVLAEKGHAETMEIYKKDDTMIVISNLSITEIYSALNQKKNRNEISDAMLANAISTFNDIILKSPKITTIEITSNHYETASRLVLRHRSLRSLDALHLATALDYIVLPIIFVSADRRFSNIVRREGLSVINFETCKCPKCGSEIQQININSTCSTCGHNNTKTIMRCTQASCAYECNQCNIEFCKKYAM